MGLPKMYALRPKIVIECPHLMNHPASIVIIGQIDKKKNKILASYRAHGGFPLEGGDIHSAMPIGGAMPLARLLLFDGNQNHVFF